jgi:hypothetical protein
MNNTTNIEYTIMSQINFCKYLFRVANLIESSSLFRTEYLKDKLLFFAIKNIMIKMYKLKDIVIYHINLGFQWSRYIRI